MEQIKDKREKNEDIKATVIIPYLGNTTEGIRRILSTLKLFKPFRTLKRILVHQKDWIPSDKQNGIVYQTLYGTCSKSENRTCRGINKKAVYPKIGGKLKFMDLLIRNSPVSLGIVLSIR